ncbi:MAG: ATP-dependent sacrificial sulfur transferase LarE [Methanolobus sp.]|nr:ATP-dependent sacrificial sulfur transferase LarE [Methanolobus sp.]
MPDEMLSSKLVSLKKGISEKESAIIAFSGGVDSSVLAYLAHDELGDNAVAVTVNLQSFPERELKCAIKVAEEMGIIHRTVDYDELQVPLISENGPKRCYYCKKEILKVLDTVRQELGFNVIIEGSNVSDLAVYRPGRQAIDEAMHVVHSPFIEFSINKREIREIAGELGLSVADKKPFPCLASRFPYGVPLTKHSIERVEKAEDFLIRLGLHELRVRDHSGIARIEISCEDMPLLLGMREDIVPYLLNLGFNYVALDLQGFRSGSMDEVL